MVIHLAHKQVRQGHMLGLVIAKDHPECRVF
jgi:hypothetical protein